MTYYIYTIQCIDSEIHDTYVGITRDIKLSTYYHEECSHDGNQYLYTFIRSHGSWSNWNLFIFSSHETYEDAKNKKIPGTLNIYDRLNVSTIYKIVCKDSTIHEQYIGQTINFDNRRCSHFISCAWGKQDTSIKLYDFIRRHGGWFNWKMSIIRCYPYCDNKNDLDRLEWYWWKTLGGTLNSKKPGSFNINYRGSDEEFEKCVYLNIIRGDHFTIKEISLDI